MTVISCKLQGKKVITKEFLEENGSDYGAKNIFTFKEALLKRDIDTLLELFPFMFGYKELDRAMSYIEGQLRLQLLVSECRQAGMSVQAIQNLCKDHDSSFNRIRSNLLMKRALGFLRKHYELY